MLCNWEAEQKKRLPLCVIIHYTEIIPYMEFRLGPGQKEKTERLFVSLIVVLWEGRSSRVQRYQTLCGPLPGCCAIPPFVFLTRTFGVETVSFHVVRLKTDFWPLQRRYQLAVLFFSRRYRKEISKQLRIVKKP